MMKTKQVICLQAILAACLCNISIASATNMSSAHYAIKWDVLDGGGGNSSSTNYIVETSNGQSTAIGASSSTNYNVVAGFESIPDSDADKILDTMDPERTVLDPAIYSAFGGRLLSKTIQ